MKIIILLSFIAAVSCLKLKRPESSIKYATLDYFKDDKEYSLPDDEGDIDKPPTIYTGDVMQATILAQENKNHGRGGKFKYTLQTQNGIEIQQVGKLKDAKTLVVMGSYSYTGGDGKRYRVKYTADEFGYHPITELDVDIPEINLNQPGPVTPRKLDLNFRSPIPFPPAPRAYAPKAYAPKAYAPPATVDRHYLPPAGYLPPNNDYLPPHNDYLPPHNDYLPPHNDYLPPHNDYLPPN